MAFKYTSNEKSHYPTRAGNTQSFKLSVPIPVYSVSNIPTYPSPPVSTYQSHPVPSYPSPPISTFVSSPSVPLFPSPSEPAKFTMSEDIFSSPQSFANTKSINEWGPWKTISSCRSGCLASSKGLRLVQRNCESGTCSGPSRSVQLCIPNEQVQLYKFSDFCEVFSNLFDFYKECSQYQPVAAFADQVCREQHWSDLHKGVQAWSSSIG